MIRVKVRDRDRLKVSVTSCIPGICLGSDKDVTLKGSKTEEAWSQTSN